jgi:hypothetical protein
MPKSMPMTSSGDGISSDIADRGEDSLILGDDPRVVRCKEYLYSFES